MLLLQFTGLSGAGKSTIAKYAKEILDRPGIPVIIVDGDEYRKTLCADLGFSKEDRSENIRRLGAVANTFCNEGNITIIAAINPYEEVRNELKQKYNAKTIWIRCNMDTLLERDTKGLYKKALLAEGHPDKITNLTGVNDPYEEPASADLVIDTSALSTGAATTLLIDFIIDHIPVAFY